MKQYLCLITILISSYTLKAQSGTWVWLKGDSSISSLGNYGTIGVSSPTNEPPARFGAAYWTDKNGDFWLFGGSSLITGKLNDLWKYNPISNEWTWVKGPQLSTNPSGVYGTMGVPSPLNTPPGTLGVNCWTDKNGDLWFFSGLSSDQWEDCGDILWRYHIATNEWTWMKGEPTGYKPNYGIKGVSTPTNTPGFRYECCSGWVYNNKLWFFGGVAVGSLHMNDLWSYDIATNNWTWESGTTNGGDIGNFGTKGTAASSNVPPARQSYSRWMDVANNFYIFAGLNNCGYLYNDVWQYNTTSKFWTWVSGTNQVGDGGTNNPFCTPNVNNIPASRTRQGTTPTRSQCTKASWTFGGWDINTDTYFNDLWLFNTENFEWTKVKGGSEETYSFGIKGIAKASNLPPGKSVICVWTDKTGAFFIFGGFSYLRGEYRNSNDLWKFIPDTACFQTGLIGGIGLIPPADTLLCEGDTIKIPIPLNCTVKVQPQIGTNINLASGFIEFFSSIATKYTVIATSLNPNDPCSVNDTLSFSIKAFPKPQAAFEIMPARASIDNPIFNCSNQSHNAIKYEWHYEGKLISSEKDIVQTFPAKGKYCLTLVAINKCGDRDSVSKCCEVYEKGKLIIPNAFTPNGDNKNDLFRAIFSEPIQKFSLLIVNRYGQEIFKSDNPNIGWDGRFNNQDQEVGVYYYLIKVKFDTPDAKEEMFKGDITLIR